MRPLRSADTRNSLEHARNTFRAALTREPDGPYADHYRGALAAVEARLAAITKRGR